jgi:arginine/lysine/histidine transporter system substrate-binding protein
LEEGNNMKNLKKVAAICLAAAMLVPFAACSKKSDKIVMSTEATFPPFEYYSGKEIVGIDVEIAKKIAAKAGKELEIRNVAFDSLSNELSSGKCDFVAAGMTVTEDRKKNMDFSDTYFDATQSIIVLKNSPIKSRTDLNGKTVGVQQGTTGDIYCTDEKKTADVHVKTVKRYNKGSDAVSDLIAGRIDAVVIDDFPAQKFVEKNSDKIVKLDDALTVEHYAIAVKKGNTDLLKIINSVLKEMKSNGELDKLVQDNKAELEKD